MLRDIRNTVKTNMRTIVAVRHIALESEKKIDALSSTPSRHQNRKCQELRKPIIYSFVRVHDWNGFTMC